MPVIKTIKSLTYRVIKMGFIVYFLFQPGSCYNSLRKIKHRGLLTYSNNLSGFSMDGVEVARKKRFF